MKKQHEYILQSQLCQYLEMQYPSVLFLSDTIAALKLTGPQQIRNQKVQKRGFKCPDLIILEPKGIYSGLLIELKIETPFKKDGMIKASQNDHLKLQYESIITLNKKGYLSMFCWSFDQAKKEIDKYLKSK